MDLEQQLIQALDRNSNALTNIENYMRQNASPKSDTPSPSTPMRNTYASDITGAGALITKTINNMSGDITTAVDPFTNVINQATRNVEIMGVKGGDVAKAYTQLTQDSFVVAQNLRQFGYDTEGMLMKPFADATSLGMNLGEFEQFVIKNAESLARFAGSVNGGVVELGKFQALMSEDQEGYRDMLRETGFSIQQLNEFFLQRLAIGKMQGLQDDEARRKAIKDGLLFRENVLALAEATGITQDTTAITSAESLKARMMYGDTAQNVLSQARLAEQMGLGGLSNIISTGRLDPNDPQTTLLLATMGESVNQAMEMNRIMKSGQDIDQKMMTEFQQTVQREAQGAVMNYGDIAHIMGGEFGGALTGFFGNQEAQKLVLGGDIEDPNERDARPEGTQTQIGANIQVQDNLTEIARGTRDVTRQAIDATLNPVLKEMQRVSGSIETLTGVANQITQGSLEGAIQESRAVVSSLQADLIAATEANDQTAMEEITKKLAEAETFTKALESVGYYFDNQITGQELAEILRGIPQVDLTGTLDNMIRGIQEVDIVKWAGKDASQLGGIMQYVPSYDPNSPEIDTQGIDPNILSLESLGNFINDLRKQFFNSQQTSDITPAIKEMENRVNSNTAQPNDDQASLQMKQLNENIETLIEVEKANGERMAELKPALLDFGNKTAGAMGSAAFSLAEQSRTNNLSSSIAKSTGVLTSASA